MINPWNHAALKKATEEDLQEVTASRAAVNEIRSGQILQQPQLHQEIYRFKEEQSMASRLI